MRTQNYISHSRYLRMPKRDKSSLRVVLLPGGVRLSRRTPLAVNAVDLEGCRELGREQRCIDGRQSLSLSLSSRGIKLRFQKPLSVHATHESCPTQLPTDFMYDLITVHVSPGFISLETKEFTSEFGLKGSFRGNNKVSKSTQESTEYKERIHFTVGYPSAPIAT